METDTRSSLGPSASETEEDSVSVSKKEVRGGPGSGRGDVLAFTEQQLLFCASSLSEASSCWFSSR